MPKIVTIEQGQIVADNLEKQIQYHRDNLTACYDACHGRSQGEPPDVDHAALGEVRKLYSKYNQAIYDLDKARQDRDKALNERDKLSAAIENGK